MLEHVEGFEVDLFQAPGFRPEALMKLPIDILLVDEDLYHSCIAGIGEGGSLWPVTKTIVLTMDHDEIETLAGGVDAIFKGAGKREFAGKIMNLVMAQALFMKTRTTP